MINIKFPRGQPRPPAQRNSFFSLNDLGLKGANKSTFLLSQARGSSPPSEFQNAPLSQRKPKSKRSCQNIVQPLVNEPGFKLDTYFDKVNFIFVSDIF